MKRRRHTKPMFHPIVWVDPNIFLKPLDLEELFKEVVENNYEGGFRLRLE